jgi:hypothetical protein
MAADKERKEVERRVNKGRRDKDLRYTQSRRKAVSWLCTGEGDAW